MIFGATFYGQIEYGGVVITRVRYVDQRKPAILLTKDHSIILKSGVKLNKGDGVERLSSKKENTII